MTPVSLWLDDNADWRWKYTRHENVFSLLPRKCKKSGESLWLKKAWRIRYEEWAGDFDEWFCDREYIWMKLKED